MVLQDNRAKAKSVRTAAKYTMKTTKNRILKFSLLIIVLSSQDASVMAKSWISTEVQENENNLQTVQLPTNQAEEEEISSFSNGENKINVYDIRRTR